MEDSELQHLMGAYYHEDFETLWSGLELYLQDDPPEDQRRLLAEISVVLADTSRTDAEIGAFLHGLGCYALIDDEPGGYRGWLEEIARRVRAHLGD
ncbi:contact-dependent growth inhibition system immunity protein [Nocardioides sp.]|uniref:contact-dependent growth inhibition system immunity protein n=1 Tax=Nocardioides sp. TaxID=35761 RepID=UPI002B266156|nr:contact-dependent growth inhibition system immunity protein [Nocardioides sp.]